MIRTVFPFSPAQVELRWNRHGPKGTDQAAHVKRDKKLVWLKSISSHQKAPQDQAAAPDPATTKAHRP
jgi:hypothetical protein